MGKVTIACVALSTLILLITFGQGIGVLHGGNVASHLSWAMATLVSVLAANLIAIVHAAQSDRIIRALRRHVAMLEDKPWAPGRPGDRDTPATPVE